MTRSKTNQAEVQYYEDEQTFIRQPRFANLEIRMLIKEIEISFEEMIEERLKQ